MGWARAIVIIYKPTPAHMQTHIHLMILQWDSFLPQANIIGFFFLFFIDMVTHGDACNHALSGHFTSIRLELELTWNAFQNVLGTPESNLFLDLSFRFMKYWASGQQVKLLRQQCSASVYAFIYNVFRKSERLHLLCLVLGYVLF